MMRIVRFDSYFHPMLTHGSHYHFSQLLGLEHDQVIVHYLTYFLYFDKICMKINIDDGACVFFRKPYEITHASTFSR